MRHTTTIQEKPRLQWGRLLLIAIDASVVGWVIYVGARILGF